MAFLNNSSLISWKKDQAYVRQPEFFNSRLYSRLDKCEQQGKVWEILGSFMQEIEYDQRISVYLHTEGKVAVSFGG